MGLEYIDGIVVLFIKEITSRMPEKGMDRCTGRMELTTKANGKTIVSMVKVKLMILMLE